jgi:hypothetical protein
MALPKVVENFWRKEKLLNFLTRERRCCAAILCCFNLLCLSGVREEDDAKEVEEASDKYPRFSFRALLPCSSRI